MAKLGSKKRGRYELHTQPVACHCAHCGKPFATRAGRTAKYCGLTCRVKAHYRRAGRKSARVGEGVQP